MTQKHARIPNDIERGLIAGYLANIIVRPDLPMRAARHVLFWLSERAEGLNLALPKDIADNIGSIYSTGFNSREFERVFLATRVSLAASLEDVAGSTDVPEPLHSNTKRICEVLELSPAALKLVRLVAYCTRFEQILYLSHALMETASPIARAASFMIDEPTNVVDGLAAFGGELALSGLIQITDGEQIAAHGGKFVIPSRVNGALDRTFSNLEEMRDELLGQPMSSHNNMADYEHVAIDRDLISKVLAGAAGEGAAGVNILIYGPPGSGKTELAKVTAAAAGLSLFGAGEDVQQEGEHDRSGRLSGLVFSQKLLSGEAKSALLFDEMEDVAVHLIRRGGSKLYLNRLLENNPVPIIWTSNVLEHIDAALLRRMTVVIELKRPPAAQRKRILEGLARRVGIALSDEELELLSRRLDATPAILESALKAAHYAGGGADAVERVALGIMRAVSGVSTRPPVAIPEFDLELARANQDLGRLARQLVEGRARAFSLCLWGPPGTGKSAFARYLAGKLGIDVMQKRASDLLGMYVGESERNIADAFAEAIETKSLLIFDECDSLLYDRKEARQSWEITQVNEMLTWMEAHPLPVVFTTNLMERIDEASLRRFTFDVSFNYLDRDALQHAWKSFLGIEDVPADGLLYENLTPGDFAKLRKQAALLGIEGKAEELAAILGEISRGKPGAKGSLGF